MTRLVDIMKRLDRHGAHVGPLSAMAAELLSKEYGPRAAAVPAELVPVAALTAAMRPAVTVHEVTAPVAALVASVALDRAPGAPPRLFRAPWAMEALEAERPLFGAVCSLAGFETDGALRLVSLDRGGAIREAATHPEWTGGPWSPKADPIRGDTAPPGTWQAEALRFAVVLALLLEAENSPVRGGGRPQFSKKRRGTYVQSSEWTIRRLFVDSGTIAALQSQERGRQIGRLESKGGRWSYLSLAGRPAAKIVVRRKKPK